MNNWVGDYISKNDKICWTLIRQVRVDIQWKTQVHRNDYAQKVFEPILGLWITPYFIKDDVILSFGQAKCIQDKKLT